MERGERQRRGSACLLPYLPSWGLPARLPTSFPACLPASLPARLPPSLPGGLLAWGPTICLLACQGVSGPQPSHHTCHESQIHPQ